MAIQQKLRTKGNAVSGSVGGKEGADSRAVLLAFLRESQDFPYCLARALLAYQQPGMQEAEGLGLWLFDFLELGTSWGRSPRAEGPHQGVPQPAASSQPNCRLTPGCCACSASHAEGSPAFQQVDSNSSHDPAGASQRRKGKAGETARPVASWDCGFCPPPSLLPMKGSNLNWKDH